MLHIMRPLSDLDLGSLQYNFGFITHVEEKIAAQDSKREKKNKHGIKTEINIKTIF